jgi:pimeloyl-ACP methyl ester carboxylesterase
VTRFVLIPGAGGAAWNWHLVVSLLEEAGHEAIAVDFPADDEEVGFGEYADLTAAACGSHRDLVLVAHSLGGFTAALAAERVDVRQLVMLNAMIPLPGETATEWGEAVSSTESRLAAATAGGYSTDFDLETYFFHDMSPELVTAAIKSDQRDEAARSFTEPCDFTAWPASVRVIAGADDRLFPVELQRRVARERLGVELETIPGGHMAALSNPAGVAHALLDGLRDQSPQSS